MTNDTDMDNAYTAAGKVLAAQTQQNTLLAQQFIELKEQHPIVVPGQHDYIERILNAMEVPYETKRIDELATLPLLQNRPIFINCSSINNPHRSLTERLKDHVRDGGKLITTDWALTLANALFPEYLAWNNQRTSGQNESFPIDRESSNSDLDSNSNSPTLSWFVENSSYPLALPMHEDVKTILSSSAFGKKYGGNPALAIALPFGKGALIHYVSHLYAQMVTLHTAQDSTASTEWAQTKGVDLGNLGTKTSTGSVATAYDTMTSILGSTTIDWNSESITKKRTYTSTVLPEVQTPLKSNEPFYLRGTGKFELERLIESLPQNYIIGRSSDTHLQLPDNRVSRHHASLQQTSAGVSITDLDSRNGTYLNKNHIHKPTELYFGDKIKIGETILEVIPALSVL